MRFVEINCAQCKKPFNKVASEVKRQLKNRPNHNFFCSPSCQSGFINDKRPIYNKTCEWCKINFVTDSNERKCCSKVCAAKFSQSHATEETRRRQSEAGKLNIHKSFCHPNWGGLSGAKGKTWGKKQDYKTSCEICGVEVITPKIKNKANKTCSRTCFRLLMGNYARSNVNCGGRTNYKKLQYKGQWMDSSWEVKVAELLDEKQIQWSRTKKTHFKWTDKSGKRRRYHPDFYLPDYDLYLEPKNKFLQQKDKFKIEQVIKEHGITLVVGELEEILSFITNLTQ